MVSPLILSLKKRKTIYGSKVKFLSPAKINLYLNLIGKYSGGFHKIESIIERISLCDQITIEIKKDPKINISTNIKSLESKDNLVVKTIELLKSNFKIPFGFEVKLTKKIPLGSGLGGGSSNAACTLLALNELLGLKLSKKKLYRLGAKLGSDVNFFICNSSFAFVEGRGEKVIPLKIKHKFNHFIIWPKASISTKEVYRNNRAKLTKFFNNANIMRYALRKGDIDLVQKCVFNALEKKAISICSKLKRVKKTIDEAGVFSKVTGSGSALYTISKHLSVNRIKSLLPADVDIYKVKTF